MPTLNFSNDIDDDESANLSDFIVLPVTNDDDFSLEPEAPAGEAPYCEKTGEQAYQCRSCSLVNYNRDCHNNRIEPDGVSAQARPHWERKQEVRRVLMQGLDILSKITTKGQMESGKGANHV